jgi:hypothetical protein
MSLLYLFRRLIDPVGTHAEKREEERKRDVRPADPQRASPTLTCRVCGYEGDNLYCPRCLALTMGPKRKR